MFISPSCSGDSRQAAVIASDVDPFLVPFVNHAGESAAVHSSMDMDAQEHAIPLGKRPVEPPHGVCLCCTQFIVSLCYSLTGLIAVLTLLIFNLT